LVSEQDKSLRLLHNVNIGSMFFSNLVVLAGQDVLVSKTVKVKAMMVNNFAFKIHPKIFTSAEIEQMDQFLKRKFSRTMDKPF